jgi:WD40 repeat protein
MLKTDNQEILYCNFNQDAGCFSVGLNNGFRIYNVDPFKLMFSRQFGSGIGIVEMLYRCNILALVGGGKSPRYPTNKVMIWDDHQNRCIGELSFRSAVKAVKLRRDRIVVVLEQKIYGYNFRDLKLVDRIETVKNPFGLCALCPTQSNTVLACPGKMKGHIRVELYDANKTTLIPAHESQLQAIALNNDGTRVATASEKGTLIRVFDTSTGQLMHELRRGAERAVIHCITFNPDSSFLALSSDKGTVHIFALNDDAKIAGENEEERDEMKQQDNKEDNEDSTMGSIQSNAYSFLSGSLKNILPKYFTSDRSFAQLRVNEPYTICAFGPDNTVIVLGADGSFVSGNYENGGECTQVQVAKFLREE